MKATDKLIWYPVDKDAKELRFTVNVTDLYCSDVFSLDLRKELENISKEAAVWFANTRNIEVVGENK